MRVTESPFPPFWWGTSLDDIGLDSLRPSVGTYGRYNYAPLPSLPVSLNGDFGWLSASPPHARHIGNDKAAANQQALAALIQASASLGLPLPPAFIYFMQTPSLPERIRSNTDCFLDLSPAPTPSPIGGGYLIRFLADSQGCLFWYLYLTEAGSDHAVVCSPDYYGLPWLEYSNGAPDPSQIVFSAESFEEFLCRFWLENEIWFADFEKTPMPALGAAYIERYLGRQT